MKVVELIQEFEMVVDDIYGLYLDAGHGFVQNKLQMVDLQKKALQEKDLSIEHQDAQPISYKVAIGNNFDGAYALHECSQANYKLRNTRNGKNYKKMANMCLMQLYAYWQDHYRNEIAKCVDKKPQEINSDILGDIRTLRESIVHHRGIATGKVEGNKFLKKFRKGEVIEMDEYFMEAVMELLKDGLLKLMTDLTKAK